MGNRYYPINGKELASVTTVTGTIDKSDALIPWAVNCAVDYVKKHASLSPAHSPDIQIIGDDRLERARTEWREVRDEAGDIGTQVHDALETLLKGVPPGRVEDARAWELYKAAKEQIEMLPNMRVLATEQKVVNEDEWYAGRFDALLEVGGETWLIDFKTGASFYPEWGMQLAAYAKAWEWNDVRYIAGTTLGLRRIDRIKVLRLDKKTLKAHWKEYGGKKDTLTRADYYKAFLGLRDAFYILKAKKAVKLAWLEGQHG